jgi:carbohydrate binding protein with CBM11 domain
MRTTLLGLLIVLSRVGATPARAQDASTQPVVICAYQRDLTSVRAANPSVRLSVVRDPSRADEPALLVEYPEPTEDPGGRDVQCAAEHQDWTSGTAISFQVKPSHDMRLSVSFIDRNRVVYTAWKDVKGDAWQPIRIPFDEIRPNPYFQPPGAHLGAAIDVSDVKFIAFAPQDQTPGRLAVSRFVVVK